MLWLLPIFAAVFQLSSASLSLYCLQCSSLLNFSAPETINVTSCSASNTPFPLCKATLNINSLTTHTAVAFNGDSNNFTDILNGKPIIKHNTKFDLKNNEFYRNFEISCWKNNSCSEEIINIYNKIKSSDQDKIVLKKLNEQLYNASYNTTDLICANNADQQIPCPNGCCELMSNGNGDNGFYRRCRESGCGNDFTVNIEQYVLGDVDTESTFTYLCNIPLCNDKTKAERIRDILKDNSLLTPTGVKADEPNTAPSIFSQTSIIIQCILTLIITKFF